MMTQEDCIKAYEAALAKQDWSALEPLGASESVWNLSQNLLAQQQRAPDAIAAPLGLDECSIDESTVVVTQTVR